MSRRKRRVSRKTLGRRYQSDFINVTMKPRTLIIDPVCDICRGRKPYVLRCKRCRGTGKDPEGDKWFDNHDRVRTTFGPKNNRLPLENSTYVTRVHDIRKKFVRDVEGEILQKAIDIAKSSDPLMEGCTKPKTKMVLEDVWVGGVYQGWKAVERPIPTTKKIGADKYRIDKTGNLVVDSPARSAVNYTYDNLPRLKAVEKLEQLKSADRLTIIDRMDKYFTVRRDAKSHLKLFFAGDKYCYVEEFETYARRSMVYTGKDYALNKMNRIDWFEIL